MIEPRITVNGVELSQSQAMAIRVACAHFFDECRGEFGASLGDLGEAYAERMSEVLKLMLDMT